MPNKSQEINLTLLTDEVQTVLTALGRLPFSEVYRIIHKIHSQANAQLDLADEAAPEEDHEEQSGDSH